MLTVSPRARCSARAGSRSSATSRWKRLRSTVVAAWSSNHLRRTRCSLHLEEATRVARRQHDVGAHRFFHDATGEHEEVAHAPNLSRARSSREQTAHTQRPAPSRSIHACAGSFVSTTCDQPSSVKSFTASRRAVGNSWVQTRRERVPQWSQEASKWRAWSARSGIAGYYTFVQLRKRASSLP